MAAFLNTNMVFFFYYGMASNAGAIYMGHFVIGGRVYRVLAYKDKP
jgi:hypothetical protein